MPEGPEIHRAADRIHAALAEREADEVFFAFEELSPYEDELSGRQVTAVDARGKAIITRFEGGLNVYSHNQLYGRWMVRNRGKVPQTNRQLRFAVHNQQKSAFLYSASEIEVLTDEELREQPYLTKLGPDPLCGDVSESDILERFEDDTFHRRQLAGLLLDQGFVAGLGNYLRSDILWYAGVHPRAKLGKLSKVRRRELGEATWLLMQRSYEIGGVTNDPERAAELEAEGASRRDHRFLAFRRESEPCYRCEEPLVKERHGGRRLYRCPSCQPA